MLKHSIAALLLTTSFAVAQSADPLDHTSCVATGDANSDATCYSVLSDRTTTALNNLETGVRGQFHTNIQGISANAADIDRLEGFSRGHDERINTLSGIVRAGSNSHATRISALEDAPTAATQADLSTLEGTVTTNTADIERLGGFSRGHDDRINTLYGIVRAGSNSHATRIGALEARTVTNGVDGVDGVDGAQGIQGERGEQGVAGVAGARGEQGVAGAVGATGAQGERGERGLQGEQGIQGVAGADGDDFDGDARLTTVENNKADVSYVDMSNVRQNLNINRNTSRSTMNSASIFRNIGRIKDNENAIANNSARITENYKTLKNSIDAARAADQANASIGQINDGFGLGFGVAGQRGAFAFGYAKSNENMTVRATASLDSAGKGALGAGIALNF